VGAAVPVLFGEFEGDVLAVVVLFVEDTLQFLVDARVLLAGHEIGGELQKGEGTEETELLRTEEAQERSKHNL
jgi:hypothetical protein